MRGKEAGPLWPKTPAEQGHAAVVTFRDWTPTETVEYRKLKFGIER